jgi:hypothetical protein
VWRTQTDVPNAITKIPQRFLNPILLNSNKAIEGLREGEKK